MAGQEKRKPTTSQPIFVDSGPGGEHAVELFLAAAEWFLREEEVSLLGPIEGEISDWMAELWAKPVEFDRRDFPGQNQAAIQGEALRESFAIVADPRSKEEKQFVDLLGNLPSEDAQRMMAALQKGDVSGFNKIRSEVVAELSRKIGPQLARKSLPALSALVARCRAARAAALSAILYKTHALCLIARARRGDRRAVLDLIKIDKLFVSDRSTAHVIRQAELRNDRNFLKQLARAITYRPRTNWRQGCRLYLYVLFSLEPQLPTLPVLQLRLDPEGTRFKSFPAFERFVERCRGEFDRLQQTAVSSENLAKKA